MTIHLRTATADELAAVVVAGIPPHSVRRVLGGYRVPDRVNDGSGELCPRCGRRLLCSLGPLGGGGDGGMMVPRSRRELTGACPVHSARAARARELAPDAIVAAALYVADGLDRAKWKTWANVIRHALDAAWEWWPPVEAAGQALEALHAFGPMASDNQPSTGSVDAQAALEVLVMGSGPHWLDCRALHTSRTG